MLNIQRLSGPIITFLLSGRIEIADVAELERLFDLEAGQNITLDLQDVTLVDRDAVKFLVRWETENVQLRNCPAFIREWIAIDSRGGRLRR